jgi:hypothetical protein
LRAARLALGLLLHLAVTPRPLSCAALKNPENKQVSDKSAVQHAAAVDRGRERDTLPTLDRVFLREQLEAALASGASPHALRGTEFEDDDEDDRDTEPSVDAMLLRDAFLAVGNNHGQ